VSRLKFSVALSPSAKIRRLKANDPVSFIPMEAIKDGLGGVDSSRAEPLSVMTAGSYNFVANGDVLLAKVTPCFENGKKGRAEGLVNSVGFATSEVYVLRPDASRIDPDFLLYLLSSEDFRFEGIRSMTGAGGLKRVSAEAVRNYEVKISDPEVQAAIARFLDCETGLIDGLIEKKTRFIALLKEKRVAVITHAVTKGIDPDAPMKDSGVDWLGRVPAHWDVLRIAALFREVTRPADPALPVLSVSIHDGVTDGELADEDRDRKVALSEDRTKYQGVAPGDLVYNMMRAWQGAFGAVTVKGLVSPAYVVAAPVTTFRTKFIEHLLHTKSAAEEIRRFSRGIADFRMRLYWDHFRALKVCLPPLEEQDRILSEIDAETARIDGLITLTERSIDLLREKRAALITAAVTGKIDVRAAA
jgi:type I restriction enzyme S subunit